MLEVARVIVDAIVARDSGDLDRLKALLPPEEAESPKKQRRASASRARDSGQTPSPESSPSGAPKLRRPETGRANKSRKNA